MHINAFHFACFGVIHELGVRDLCLVLRLVKLLKNSEKHQAHDEPHADFLEHIAVQIDSFSGFIQVLKRIAIPKYLILLPPFFKSEWHIYLINPLFFEGIKANLLTLLLLLAYLGGLRFRPKRKISEERALEAFGLRDATVLKTFLKDSTIWL